MRNRTAACLAAATWLQAQRRCRPPRRRLPAPPDRARRAELRAFARAWLAHPIRVGAILPTSAAAVTAILELAGDQTWRGAKRIVELAAGPLPGDGRGGRPAGRQADTGRGHNL